MPISANASTPPSRCARRRYNTSKHAQASNVLLRLVARDGRVQLQVVDDGCGCDPEQALRSGGSGLGGMHERLRLYGGGLELHSAPGPAPGCARSCRCRTADRTSPSTAALPVGAGPGGGWG
ncbi:MAG: hypothetical protein LH470_05310, partial [Lysobacter sp.]|nr:hypothetical protein [Lysobacter sp.]